VKEGSKARKEEEEAREHGMRHQNITEASENPFTYLKRNNHRA
jgi:hypothetical protein